MGGCSATLQFEGGTAQDPTWSGGCKDTVECPNECAVTGAPTAIGVWTSGVTCKCPPKPNATQFHKLTKGNNPLHDDPPEQGILRGEISVVAWSDTNANGVRESGEDGLPSIVVELWSTGPDGLVQTPDDIFVRSDAVGDDTPDVAHGLALFTMLSPGSYFVRVSPSSIPSGMVPTTPIQSGCLVVVIGEHFDIDVGFH